MQPAQTLARLFQDEPTQWGLRGDPYLWRDMKATLGNSMYPSTEEQFTTLLEQTYQHLTGIPLSNPDPIFVERYSSGGQDAEVSLVTKVAIRHERNTRRYLNAQQQPNVPFAYALDESDDDHLLICISLPRIK
jgi:hypothetical protein